MACDKTYSHCAGVAELVDALVLGTSGLGRGGSSPFTRTTFWMRVVRFYSLGTDLILLKTVCTLKIENN